MAPSSRPSLPDRLRLDTPVVQAGMGGGVAGAALAGAVSAAGGLGTVAMLPPDALAGALRDAGRRAGGRPVAANLLAPFTRPAHLDACVAGGAALVVLHGGLPRRALARLRRRGVEVYVTVGTPQQARRALAAGATGLVVQGIEAGGHLLGVEPVDAALTRVRALAPGVPILAAGGVRDAADVRRLLDLGADAAVAGTRFLLTDESAAHPEYKRRLLHAPRTLLTLLFGIGWPLRHRVVPNAATDRWCASDELGPPLVRLAGRLTAPLGRVIPLQATGRLAALQRPAVPIFSPALPLAGMDARAVERCALYAGESVLAIDDLIPAREALARLAPG